MNTFHSVSPSSNANALPPLLYDEADGMSVFDPLLAEQTMLAQVMNHYQQSLLHSHRALTYLSDRKISLDVIERLGLGYSDRTLGYHLPCGKTDEGGYTRGLLQRNGLLLSTGHERMRGAVVVPDKNTVGQYRQFYGQKITPWLRPGTDYEPYCQIGEACFFNQVALQRYQDIILCQNPIDMAIFLSAGIENVVAIAGLRGFNESHLVLIEQSGIRCLDIAFESSRQGKLSANLVAQSLLGTGIRCRRLLFLQETNIGDLVMSKGLSAILDIVEKAKAFKPSCHVLKAR